MTPEAVVTIGQHALTTLVMLAAPILIAALVAGLVIGMLQAATQINEMTLSFIPKLGVVVGVLWVTGPWMLQLITQYTVQLFHNIPFALG